MITQTQFPFEPIENKLTNVRLTVLICSLLFGGAIAYYFINKENQSKKKP